MKQKNLLMPNGCQRAGWWMLILIPAILACYYVLYTFFRGSALFALVNNNSRYMTMTLGIVAVVSLFLICLSKEKTEDEMISALRMRTVTIIAYILFFSILVYLLYCSLDAGFRFGHSWGTIFFLLQALTWPLFFAPVLYIAIFKAMLWHSKKDERQ